MTGQGGWLFAPPEAAGSRGPSFEFEHALRLGGVRLIAGVDEAGRGPLAGPVVAAAVIFLEGAVVPRRLDDSKKLAPGVREELREQLLADERILVGVGIAEVAEIDEWNILRATHAAMRRAVDALPSVPEHALIDGLPVRPFPIPHTAVVGGDARSLSIAAASVLAKVARDRMMLELDTIFPGYGFAQHKGYGTNGHLRALERMGPCGAHRRSFAPVARFSRAGG